MLTWHVVCNTEIPIVVILACIELSRFNIFHCHLVICTLLLPPSARLTSFKCAVNDIFFTVRLRFQALGMNWWWLRVHFKCAWCSKSRPEKFSVTNTSSELTKNEVIPSTLASAKSKSCFGVRIWSEKGRWRLACAASLLMVSPTLSQAFFPSNLAKNSIQPGCGGCFDKISGSLSFWSSWIVLLSHHWNRRLCAEMEIRYWRSVHESVSKNCTP